MALRASLDAVAKRGNSILAPPIIEPWSLSYSSRGSLNCDAV